MEKKWIYLEPYTFIWNKSASAYIYNSLSGVGRRFKHTEETKIILKALEIPENLYSTEIDAKLLNNNSVQNFLTVLKSLIAGNILPYKPVILPPILNLQFDVNRIKDDDSRTVGENILSYLYQIDLYIDSNNKDTDYWMRIKNFFTRLKKHSCNKINIHIQHIQSVDELRRFVNEIEGVSDFITICVPVNHFSGKIIELIKKIETNLQIRLIISEIPIVSRISNINNTFKDHEIEVQWEFHVNSEDCYEITTSIINDLNLNNFEIIPLYTGSNIEFLKNNLYLDEEDLQYPKLCKREVFAHQVINNNYFGKLTILPDCKVYAHPYFPELGVVEDDIRDLIFKEFTNGKSWLRIRDMEPCCDCVYQWLCPSPSNYELTIGKPNLCHVQL